MSWPESDEEARQETPAQRLDRNWNELLQEPRVAQTGAQILVTGSLALVFWLAVGATAAVVALIAAVVLLAGGCFLVPLVALRRDEP